MMNQKWYVARAGQRWGPFAIAELQRQYFAGQLSPADMVWTEGWPTWAPAGSVAPIVGQAMPATVWQGGYAPPGTGYTTRPPVPSAGDRMLLPVGRSGWDIAAGYLGLLFIVPLFGFGAIICSILALRDMKQHPEKHGMGRVITGFVGGAIGVAFTILIVFAVVNDHHSPMFIRR